MLAKTIRHLLPFIAVVYFSTNSLRADEALAPLADPANALKALQSKIDALRKEGKTYEADQLEVKRSKAVLRVAGVPTVPVDCRNFMRSCRWSQVAKANCPRGCYFLPIPPARCRWSQVARRIARK